MCIRWRLHISLYISWRHLASHSYNSACFMFPYLSQRWHKQRPSVPQQLQPVNIVSLHSCISASIIKMKICSSEFFVSLDTQSLLANLFVFKQVFKLFELFNSILLITYFSTVVPFIVVLFFPVGLSSLTRYFQQVL